MATANLDKEMLKQVMKEALAEALQEQRGLLHEVLAEVLEDFALAEAIREGERPNKPHAMRSFGHCGGSNESDLPQELHTGPQKGEGAKHPQASSGGNRGSGGGCRPQANQRPREVRRGGGLLPDPGRRISDRDSDRGRHH